MLSRVSAAALVLACGLVSSSAYAQDRELRVATLEHGSWPETIAALQTDVHAQGRSVHVIVFDESSRRAPCGRYVLQLDPSGVAAFRTGTCDPTTNATELVLASRTELFAHDGPVPRPRAILLVATEVRFGDSSGGAAITGGAALDCSVGIRPFLDDLEHGGVVYLGPDRYEVHPTQTTVMVSVEATGWSLHARSAAAMTIAYDVVDRATQEVVLHDTATLACAAGPSPSAAPHPTTTAALSERASRVLILETTDLPRPAEVVVPLDVHEPVGDEATAMRILRERAAELGADAVVGVEFHHGHGGGPIHLSGLAVRFIDLPRRF
jgi:hypothetical protein